MFLLTLTFKNAMIQHEYLFVCVVLVQICKELSFYSRKIFIDHILCKLYSRNTVKSRL